MLAPLLADILFSLTLSPVNRHLSACLMYLLAAVSRASWGPPSAGATRFHVAGKVVGSPRLCEIWEQRP